MLYCPARMKKSYSVSSDILNAAGEVSTTVKRLLQQLGFPPSAIKRFSIALYEGEMNMAIHAGGGTAEIEIESDSVSAELVDQGPGIVDLDLAMQEGYSTAADYIRELGFGAGMGLPNMKRASDEFEVQSAAGEGTRVYFKVLADGGK